MSDGDGSVAVPQVVVSNKLSGAIADLVSIASDFGLVAAFCGELESRPLQPAADVQDDDPVGTALWQALAITYRRPFREGKSHGPPRSRRLRLPDQWIDELGSRELHNWLLELADRHIAHRVSDAEQVRVVVYLNPGEPRDVIGTGHFAVRLMRPDRPIEEVRRLVDGLLALIQRELSVAQELLIKQARKVGIDELYRIAGESSASPQEG